MENLTKVGYFPVIKQSPRGLCKKKFCEIFRKIYKKAPVIESYF